jgi:hypothetical protein
MSSRKGPVMRTPTSMIAPAPRTLPIAAHAPIGRRGCKPLIAAACPECDCVLDLHQPVAAEPDRLLGVCCECRGWFLVPGPDCAGEVIALSLPEAGA